MLHNTIVFRSSAPYGEQISCASATTLEATVTSTLPIELVRDIEQRWQARADLSRTPMARNDNNAGAGHCPSCDAAVMIAPVASEYCGKGILHHYWLCGVCGHEWITVARVPE